MSKDIPNLRDKGFVMEIFTPEYYRQFRCIAAACPDSCCKDWEVDVDAAAASAYRALPGELGARLRQVLQDTEDGTVMAIENGRCPMWRQDGLCQIQVQLGQEALCRVCQDFPRLRHDYGDFVELGLELSCPEAARLILNGQAQDMTSEQAPGNADGDYDKDAMRILRRSRAEIRRFLGNETYTLPQSLAVLLLYGHEVQAELDGGEPAVLDPENALRQGESFAQAGSIRAILDFFLGLEILTPQWKSRLACPPVGRGWAAQDRALIRYMIDRYWLQAVADYDLISRVKLGIIACLTVNGLGGDPVQTAQLFSKEIENDPDNVERILDGAYTSPALTDAALLGLLLK